MLQSMGSQKVRHDWATEQQDFNIKKSINLFHINRIKGENYIILQQMQKEKKRKEGRKKKVFDKIQYVFLVDVGKLGGERHL